MAEKIKPNSSFLSQEHITEQIQDDVQTKIDQAHIVTGVKVNGQSVITQENIAEITVPTKVSDLNNDAQYISGVSWGEVTGDILNQTDLKQQFQQTAESLATVIAEETIQRLSADRKETTERVDADDKLTTALNKEIQERTTAVATEIANRNTAINTAITNEATSREQAISTEIQERQSGDNALQTQIDAIESRTDVIDVVACYNKDNYPNPKPASDLVHYAGSISDKDVIKVLIDESHNKAVSYYRWHRLPILGDN